MKKIIITTVILCSIFNGVQAANSRALQEVLHQEQAAAGQVATMTVDDSLECAHLELDQQQEALKGFLIRQGPKHSMTTVDVDDMSPDFDISAEVLVKALRDFDVNLQDYNPEKDSETDEPDTSLVKRTKNALFKQVVKDNPDFLKMLISAYNHKISNSANPEELTRSFYTIKQLYSDWIKYSKAKKLRFIERKEAEIIKLQEEVKALEKARLKGCSWWDYLGFM